MGRLLLDPQVSGESGGKEPNPAEADALIAAAIGNRATSGNEGTRGTPIDDQQAQGAGDDDKVTLEVDGVAQTFNKKDLAAAWLKAQKADTTLAVADERLQEVAATKKLVQFIEQFDDDQTAAFQQILANPKLLTQLVKPSSSNPDDDDGDDDLSLLVGNRSSPRKSQQEPNGLQEQVNQLTDAVRLLLEKEHNDQVKRNTVDTKKNVLALMETMPLYEEDPLAKGWALDNVLAKLALNPQINVEETLRDVTKRIQEAKAGAAEDRSEVGGGPGPITLARPKQAFSGRDLEGGKVADHLTQLLDSL